VRTHGGPAKQRTTLQFKNLGGGDAVQPGGRAMAKSYPPQAVVLGALVLAIGCGGSDSVASKSARAFREAQQRGETFGGDGHAHGHAALAPGAAGESTSAGEQAMDHAAMGHRAANGGPAGHSTGAMDHSTMGQRSGSGTKPKPAAAGDHASMGHGTAAQPSSPAMDHAAMEHGPAPAAPADPGQPGMDHAAMGHGSAPAAASRQRGQPPVDHAAMGHGAETGASQPGLAGIERGTTVAPAGPVPAGRPAATLAPDPLDAPAPTSVLDAQRSAAMASEMRAGGGHGGHAGTGTYRHVDAGRRPQGGTPSEYGGHGESWAPSTPSTIHGDHDDAGTAGERGGEQVVYTCPMHPQVRSDEPGSCPICGMELERRAE
jgi:hypothetical protein